MVYGTQTSVLINFIPESRLLLYKPVPLTRKQPRRPETGIKDGFEENYGTQISTWNIASGKTDFSHVLLLPEIFHWNDPERGVLFTFHPDSPETFSKG